MEGNLLYKSGKGETIDHITCGFKALVDTYYLAGHN